MSHRSAGAPTGSYVALVIDGEASAVLPRPTRQIAGLVEPLRAAHGNSTLRSPESWMCPIGPRRYRSDGPGSSASGTW